MSRMSIPRRPLPATSEHEVSDSQRFMPRRPDGVTLIHQASQQSIGSFRRHTSTDSTMVDVTSSSEHLMKPSPHEQDSVNDGMDTQPPRNDDAPATTSSGYAQLPADSSMCEASLNKERPNSSWRDSRLLHDGRKKRRSCMDHLEAWYFELGCCVLSVLLLAAISGILWYYESKPERDFWGNISLNTIVAFVATLCRAAMVIPIAEGISQLKWNSFASGTRALMDLYTFDQASRGPFGSMMLLFRTRGRLLGVSTVAALVMVSGLVTSPMTQATIHYDYRPRETVSAANATRALSLDGYPAGVQDSMKRAALRSMFTDHYEPEPFKPKPLCPALECAWDWFEALDVCATTSKVTDKLDYSPSNYDEWAEFNNKDKSLKTPEDEARAFTKVSTLDEEAAWVRATDDTGPMLLSSSGPNLLENPEKSLTPWDQGKIEDISEVFLGGIVFIFAPPNVRNFTRLGQKPGLEAIQITWHWCVHNYTFTGRNGSVDTNTTDGPSSPRRSKPSNPKLKLEDVTHRVPDYSFDFIGEALSGGPGSITGPSNEIRHERWRMFYPDLDLNNKETESAHLTTDLNDLARHERSYEEVVAVFAHSVAAAVGNVIRNIPENETTGLWSMETRKAKAKLGEPILYIRWQWLSLLGTQVVFTLLFLAYVIINTAIINVEVVKSSNIGELLALNQLRDGTQRLDSPAEEVLSQGVCRELGDKNVLGKLRRSEGEWSLVISEKKKSSSKKTSDFFLGKSLLGIFRL